MWAVNVATWRIQEKENENKVRMGMRQQVVKGPD
jgi:hypothetical protein